MTYTVNRKVATSNVASAAASFFVSRISQEMKVEIELDPNGGIVDSVKFTAVVGSKFGELPAATGNGDKLFAGWFNADGVQVTAESIVSSATMRLQAKWADSATVTFVPNGGTLSGATSIKAYVGFPLSASGVEFPSATGTEDKPYLKMWSTAAEGGERITPDTIYDGSYTTIYAQYVNATFSVELKPSGTEYRWELATSVPNPDASLYDGVYQSTNKGMDDTTARMRITFLGYSNFRVYIRSYAESNYDYTIASQLDAAGVTESNAKATTKGNQKGGTDIGSYTLVEYPNDGGEHFIEVGYRKDSSDADNDDRGYVLIGKEVL